MTGRSQQFKWNGVARDDSLLKSFHTAISLTGYDSHQLFVNKLAQNASENGVKDMFSPGLPYYFVAVSSVTSGKKAKLFAKYHHTDRLSLEDVDKHANPVSTRGGKDCIVYSLIYKDIIEVVGNDRAPVV